MPRWSLVVLLVVAVVCAGVGAGLLDLLHAGGYGWTAYAPLHLASGNGVYMPVDPTWLEWRPRVGAALLAAGAGTTGAILAALLMRRGPGPSR